MANFISILRVLLAFVVIALLTCVPKELGTYWLAFALTAMVMWMDGLDGYVARKFNLVSDFGAMLDILSDRIVELTYWIAFAVWLWVPLWIPILVMTRGIAVDGLRAVAKEKGFTAFGSNTMMQSPLGVLLVSSRFSRWTYAVTKALAFALLILAHAPNADSNLLGVAMTCTYVAVGFCVVRGLPVLLEARRFI